MAPDFFPLRFTIMGAPRVWKNTKSGFVRLGGGKGQPCPGCGTKLLVDVQSSKAARAWMKSAIKQLESQWRYVAIPKSVQLNAAIVSHMPTRAMPDADNLLGGPCDAMVEAEILEDDCCIASFDRSRRRYDKERPRVEIELTLAADADLILGVTPGADVPDFEPIEDPSKVELEF